MNNAKLTICIPAYNCALFIQKALSSLQQQTYRDWTAFISVDYGDDDSLEKCRKLIQDDSRFVLFEQKQRIGWAANINFLLRKVQTPLYMIHPHDDSLAEDYLELLVNFLDSHPDYYSAVGKIRFTGRNLPDMQRANNVGSAFDRLSQYLLEERNGLLFRAIVRNAGDDCLPLLEEHALESKGVDLLWILEILLRGNAACIPEAIYFKHKWDGSVTSSWSRKPKEFRVRSVLIYTSLMSDLIDSAPQLQSVSERNKLQRLLFLYTLGYFMKKPKYFDRKWYSVAEMSYFLGLIFASKSQRLATDESIELLEDESACRLLASALEAERDSVQASSDLGHTYSLSLDIETLRGTNTQPGDLFSWMLDKAHSEQARGDKRGSLFTIRELASLSRNKPHLLHKLSFEFQKRDALTDAIEVASLASELAPEKKAYLNRYGALLIKHKRLDEAKAIFEQSLQNDPNDLSALYHLSIVYFHQNELTLAQEKIDTAIALAPGMDRHRKLREMIQARL